MEHDLSDEELSDIDPTTHPEGIDAIAGGDCWRLTENKPILCCLQKRRKYKIGSCKKHRFAELKIFPPGLAVWGGNKRIATIIVFRGRWVDPNSIFCEGQRG